MFHCGKTICLVSLLIISSSAHSQFIKMPDYKIETGAIVSTGNQTPFWLLSNQYGMITPDKFNAWIKLGLKTSLSTERKIDYDYGFDLVDRQSNAFNKLYLHQAYLRLKFYFLNFQAGVMEEKFGNQDSSLSSGGLLWSGNARPMPRISILMPEYMPVPLTKGYLEFKGGLSHGWFDDNQFVKDSWLHHKYYYLQVGGKLPVHIHYGFHHYAQWGGESVDPAIGKLPRSFSDLLRIFFAKEGGSNSPILEQENVLGNHLGSRNFGLDAELSKIKLSFYWQTIIDDSTGRAFRNIKDGLWGISFRTKNKDRLINGLVYEFINTTDQSGRYNYFWLLDGKMYPYQVPGGEFFNTEGNDNYFNGCIYEAGWTYHSMVIGTPLITSRGVLEAINSDESYIWNNKVLCHHFGLEGKYRNLLYKIFMSYYLNYGTNVSPFESTIPQYSLMFQAQIEDKLPWGINASLAVGLDHGQLYGNNAGIRLSFLKQSGGW